MAIQRIRDFCIEGKIKRRMYIFNSISYAIDQNGISIPVMDNSVTVDPLITTSFIVSNGQESLNITTQLCGCDIKTNLVITQNGECPGDQFCVAVQVIGGTPPYSYFWTINGSDIHPDSPSNSRERIPNNPTCCFINKGIRYEIGVVVTDSKGCSSTYNKITINPKSCFGEGRTQGDEFYIVNDTIELSSNGTPIPNTASFYKVNVTQDTITKVGPNTCHALNWTNINDLVSYNQDMTYNVYYWTDYVNYGFKITSGYRPSTCDKFSIDIKQTFPDNYRFLSATNWSNNKIVLFAVFKNRMRIYTYSIPPKGSTTSTLQLIYECDNKIPDAGTVSRSLRHGNKLYIFSEYANGKSAGDQVMVFTLSNDQVIKHADYKHALIGLAQGGFYSTKYGILLLNHSVITAPYDNYLDYGPALLTFTDSNTKLVIDKKKLNNPDNIKSSYYSENISINKI